MRSLCSLMLLVTLIPAQAEAVAKFYGALDPVVWQLERQGTLWSIHGDGMKSALFVDLTTGTVITSVAYIDGQQERVSNATNPPGDPPLPTIKTTWTDAAGVTHEVLTPMPSSTPSMMRKTLEQHNALVGIMQSAHPPAPPKPTPAPVPPGP